MELNILNEDLLKEQKEKLLYFLNEVETKLVPENQKGFFLSFYMLINYIIKDMFKYGVEEINISIDSIKKDKIVFFTHTKKQNLKDNYSIQVLAKYERNREVNSFITKANHKDFITNLSLLHICEYIHKGLLLINEQDSLDDKKKDLLILKWTLFSSISVS